MQAKGAKAKRGTAALPPVVSASEWQAARDAVLVREKAATRMLDELAAARRRLPMVRIDKDYVFEGPACGGRAAAEESVRGGPAGKARLSDMFDGRRQLIVYHFMFAPGVHGWPEAGCPGCSFFVDQLGHPAHRHARGISFALISRAPLANLRAYQARMGWTVPWYSSAGNDFNADFGLSREAGEIFGLSVFLRDGDDVYRTYFNDGRGMEALGSAWTFYDLTPYGRQEEWENSPEGWPQEAPYQWWRRHDEY